MKRLNDYITEFININNVKRQAYDTVDLDLPSGIKWATCNIGADSPESHGLLFQWGRTDGYKCFDRNHNFLSYKDYHTTSGTKYLMGEILQPKDDAAYQATNGELRMPTKDEIKELIDNTNSIWDIYNGSYGRKFISKKDKSKFIFIPADGQWSEINKNGRFKAYEEDGCIWSSEVSSFDNDFCGCITFDYQNIKTQNHFCRLAKSIRGVCN